jgi:predicted permease
LLLAVFFFVMHDLRFAVRQLTKSPGFTAIVALSLALGIGATATVMCWYNALVRRPLPGVLEQGRLIALVSNQGGGCASLPDLRDFANLSDIFVGAEASMNTSACLTVNTAPEWIEAQVVTANFFPLLGVKPILGRTFLPEEDQKPSGDPVLVISERLWLRRFGGDRMVLGRTVDLNRHAFTIIGVVPAVFRGTVNPALVDAWAPASMIWEVRNQGHGFLTQRTARGWHNLARLQPGVSLAEANAAVVGRAEQIATAFPNESRDVHYRVASLAQCPWGAQTVIGPALQLLFAMSLGVHLLVMANIMNLLLARAVARRKEIAIRLAAGASRGQLLRQLAIEGLLLSALGAAAGWFLASWLINIVGWFLPDLFAVRLQLEFALDATTIWWTTLLAFGTGLAFGLVPLLQTVRPDLLEVLKEGGRSSSAGSGHHRLRNVLVIAEVALALVLLTSAALCVKALNQARRIDLGFNPDHVLLAGLQIGMNGYTRDTGPAFYRELRARVAETPGVEEAALASWFPLGLSGCKGTGVVVDGYERNRNEDLTYEFAIVSTRYFTVMQIPLVAGRDFADADDAKAPRAAIVNEHFARKFWPGQNPIGRRFQAGGESRTVIGVAKAGKYNRLEERPWCFMYFPDQQGVPDLDLNLCVRTTAEPEAFAATLRRVLRELDPTVDLMQVMPLRTYSGLVLFPQRMAATLLALLGVIALLLALMGVYSVIAYGVRQRTQEFGVRIALGAEPRNVIWQVLLQGLALAAGGTGVGLLLTLGAAQLLQGFLFGVSRLDAVTFLGVVVIIGLVAALACVVPARRASVVNPLEALRHE